MSGKKILSLEVGKKILTHTKSTIPTPPPQPQPPNLNPPSKVKWSANDYKPLKD